ncbi:hypothetical protein ABBQ38_004092 [Trebouxia sp. C0009 RCD-2024]
MASNYMLLLCGKLSLVFLGPKAGTTSLANRLKDHPGLSGIDGLPWHEALSKESHYFNGVFGRSHASSALLYKSFFPTVLCKWWSEYIRGVKKWMCFDACPVTACLPYTAKRMRALTPDAKLIFMLRDPVHCIFSAELMISNMGMPLAWSLSDPATQIQAHVKEQEDDAQLWKDLKDLQPGESLPANMPELFYTRLNSLLMCGCYADRIQPFLQEFPRSSMMFIDFNEFINNTDGVVRETDYRGRRMHPSVKQYLTQYFRRSNSMLYSLLGRDFQWADLEQ